jgi:uroporphyrin-III C-methyltransferase/precorrin-2 dehydrogenase/sirohydrochlorin ferrochelatase
MASLARLPIFLALHGKRAIVAGGNAAAAWKAELLSAAGARVEVFAETACEELRALLADPPGGTITLHANAVAASACAEAALAVGAIEDDVEAERFAEAMRAAGIPVNIVDKPSLSDFTFGAIVNRSPLVIGISTDGAAPLFAQVIRAKIERLIPRGFSGWAQAASTWRQRINALDLAAAGRRLLWSKFADRAIVRPDHQPAEADLDALIAETQNESTSAGSVVMVDAGAGDPELITLRALRALQSADVILIGPGVSPDIVDFARREAKKMMIGGEAPSEVTTLMLTFALAGRRVVRLGSAPCTAREAAACRAAGIPLEIVPGVVPEAGAAITAAE